jgi:HAD superfamily hydrolase (TIGR01459 family)
MIAPISHSPALVSGLGALASRYDVILSDIWGVLHNGLAAYPAAGEALTQFRAQGGTVILITNAPRPAIDVVALLDGLKVMRSAWDGIVTSGDVTRAMLEAEGATPFFWLGPARDRPIFDGLAAPIVPLEEARNLVCTGLLDDDVEGPDDYADLLAQAHARDITFICANPDLVVERGGRLVYCAGALAQAYEKLGGKTLYAGKPFPPIYQEALAIASSIRGAPVDLSRVLAIGDAIRTDIAGAKKLGVDSLFCARGIHTHELGLDAKPLHGEALAHFLAKLDHHPDFAIEMLQW